MNATGAGDERTGQWDTTKVQVIPLVPCAELPREAVAGLRKPVPPGYGVQEQCLPFTAATALGLLLPAPFDFGLCRAERLPPGARRFRAPRAPDAPGVADMADVADVADGEGDDDLRWFYVCDRPRSRFAGNAFTFDELHFADARGARQVMRPVQPGLSFFERHDQRHLFKIHLPYVLRTPALVDSLFIAPVNRPAPLALLAGLVETDWYANPVNLVVQRPAQGDLHVTAGTVMAQLVLVPRAHRRAAPVVVDEHDAMRRSVQDELLRWYVAHGRDRSAYRRLARSRQGRLAVAGEGGSESEGGAGAGER